MSPLSFHAPGKTFLKMSKIVKEICVKVGMFFSDFWWEHCKESVWALRWDRILYLIFHNYTTS